MENNKINIAELLRNCPHGMELDSPAYNNLYFDNIIDSDSYPIKCYTTYNGMLNTVFFTKYGEIRREENAKCVIFPKGKTTWEGFQGSFKDGDILAYTNFHTTVFIYRNKEDGSTYTTSFYVGYTIGEYYNFHIYNKSGLISLNGDCDVRLATEEEKQKLFQAIKDNGYRWNAETKTLEKLVEPKFNVGDKITNGNISITIDYMDNECYYDMGRNKVTRLFIQYQDDWELVPDKFDISTLKPFDSRVLVRDNDNDEWRGHFFSHYNNNKNRPYICIGDEGLNEFNQCIPYEGNEHLLGKIKKCDEYYKTW